MSLVDQVRGRLKQAAGDLADNPALRRQGIKEERKGAAKEELARAQEESERRAKEVADLERQTS
ncbi:MAG TPA: hypothetical protein VIJ20_00450 [Solirubrobacteraceae bacterium]